MCSLPRHLARSRICDCVCVWTWYQVWDWVITQFLLTGWIPVKAQLMLLPNTSAIGATTACSSWSSNTLHEASGRGAVMQGHAWRGDIFISGVHPPPPFFFFSFPGWLEALSFDCLYSLISEALQWLKSNYNSINICIALLKCHSQYVCLVPWMYVLSGLIGAHVMFALNGKCVHLETVAACVCDSVSPLSWHV